jgi:hypothetical protein
VLAAVGCSRSVTVLHFKLGDLLLPDYVIEMLALDWHETRCRRCDVESTRAAVVGDPGASSRACDGAKVGGLLGGVAMDRTSPRPLPVAWGTMGTGGEKVYLGVRRNSLRPSCWKSK